MERNDVKIVCSDRGESRGISTMKWQQLSGDMYKGAASTAAVLSFAGGPEGPDDNMEAMQRRMNEESKINKGDKYEGIPSTAKILPFAGNPPSLDDNMEAIQRRVNAESQINNGDKYEGATSTVAVLPFAGCPQVQDDGMEAMQRRMNARSEISAIHRSENRPLITQFENMLINDIAWFENFRKEDIDTLTPPVNCFTGVIVDNFPTTASEIREMNSMSLSNLLNNLGLSEQGDLIEKRKRVQGQLGIFENDYESNSELLSSDLAARLVHDTEQLRGNQAKPQTSVFEASELYL